MYLKEHITTLLVLGACSLSIAQPGLKEVQSLLEQRFQLATGELQVSSHHSSEASGLTHYYFQQFHRGIPVRNALASAHLSKEGEMAHLNASLLANFGQKAVYSGLRYTMPEAAQRACRLLGIPVAGHFEPFSEKRGGYWLLDSKGSTGRPVSARLVYEKRPDGAYAQAWELTLFTPDMNHCWLVCLDASSGELLSRQDLAMHCNITACEKTAPEAEDIDFPCVPFYPEDLTEAPEPSLAGASQIFTGQYQHFPLSTESPLYGSRVVSTADVLANSTASPFGWHNTSGNPGAVEFEFTKGNNVYAYYDNTGAGQVSEPLAVPIITIGGAYIAGNVPDGGPALNFVYNGDISAATPSTYIRDAVTNAFVWANMLHDIFYLYGFDEAAGNFQQNNHGQGGLGGDYLQAEVQDIGNVNNANFITPPDGQNPVMQLYLWPDVPPSGAPPRDAAFDNLIIAHEWAHGLSLRLVGGAMNTACLNNPEQGGEGYSDFFGMLLTLRDLDNDGMVDENTIGEGVRGIANFLLGEPQSYRGIRPAPYATDQSINDYTYGDVPGMAQPHGVGFVWCTMLWEMAWELINRYGFEPNLYKHNSTAGNIRAFRIVVEALKMTPCQPSFIDMRDAVLAANTALYDGEGQDAIWAAFARRGLGASATAGGNEAFDPPSLLVTKTVDKEEAMPGELVNFTVTVRNSGFEKLHSLHITDVLSGLLEPVSISNPGNFSGNTAVAPVPGNLPPGASYSINISARVRPDAPVTEVIYENGANNLIEPDFTSLGAISTLDNPYEGSRAWFFAEASVPTEVALLLHLDLDPGHNNYLSFWHHYDTEAQFDGAVVEILEGTQWRDLGGRMVRNGYNSTVATREVIGLPSSPIDGRRAFSGSSGQYINTIIDMNGYAGPQTLRFRLVTDLSVEGNGWLADYFQLLDLSHIPNTACASAQGGISACGSAGPLGAIIGAPAPPLLPPLSLDAAPEADGIALQWHAPEDHNNAGFEVERRANGQAHFETIARIKESTGQSQNNYVLLDRDVANGAVYEYRLRQVNRDEKSTFSRAVSARATGGNAVPEVKVFPNPAREQLYLSFSYPPPEMVQVVLSGIDGKRLLPPISPDVEANDAIRIALPELPAGLYLLNITADSRHYTRRIVIRP